jgi:DNA-binding transcriptional regulator LsrR (DeoR family)
LLGLARAAGRTLEDLKASGIVGDIALNTIAADGSPQASGIEDVLFNVSHSDLLHAAAGDARRVVLVAGGRAKAPVIRAALRGRLFNVLITDCDTAQILLD